MRVLVRSHASERFDLGPNGSFSKLHQVHMASSIAKTTLGLFYHVPLNSLSHSSVQIVMGVTIARTVDAVDLIMHATVLSINSVNVTQYTVNTASL